MQAVKVMMSLWYGIGVASQEYILRISQLKRRRTSTKPKVKAESDSDDAPLVTKTNGHSSMSKKPPKVSGADIGESEDSDVPLGEKLKSEKAEIEKRAEKEAQAIHKGERKSSGKKPAKKEDLNAYDDTPKKKQPNGTPTSKKRAKPVKEEDSDDDVPLSRKAPTKKAKVEAKGTPTKKSPKKGAAEKTAEDEEAEAEEEEYRWWEDPTKGDGTIKWTTLEHNGVVFPPPYEPLPKKVKMRYDGVPVSLALEAEEVAGFFGTMLNSTHNVENPTFQKNFFNDFKKVLKDTGGATDKDGNKVAIKEFSKCDFKPIFEYYDGERAKKKALTSAEKKAIKAEKDEAEAPYMYCMWDGRKQKVGNFRVEPPGLFRGRGEHPKTGMVKSRVPPEAITINIGKGAMVPAPPEGHRWKEVKHDQEGTWLAMWQENINGNYKYVMLAANSDVKGQSDYKKFEKARELKVSIVIRIFLICTDNYRNILTPFARTTMENSRQKKWRIANELQLSTSSISLPFVLAMKKEKTRLIQWAAVRSSLNMYPSGHLILSFSTSSERTVFDSTMKSRSIRKSSRI